MTEFEQIELGEYCEDLLQQEHFTTLTKLFENQLVQDILNSAPGERDRREQTYAQFNGVRDFLNMLTALVRQKNELLEQEYKPALSEFDALPPEVD